MRTLQNAVQYKGKIYVSTHRHDMVYFDDRSGFIDGGNEYARGADRGAEERPVVRLYLDEESTIDERSQLAVWGTKGLSGNDEVQYVFLKDCDSGHLTNILVQLPQHSWRVRVIHHILASRPKKTVTTHLRNRLLARLGDPYDASSTDQDIAGKWSPGALLEVQIEMGLYDRTINRLCRNRITMGTLRYGAGGLDIYYTVNGLDTVHNYIDQYVVSGNLEKLCDAMNYAIFAYNYPYLDYMHGVDGYRRDAKSNISRILKYWTSPRPTDYFHAEDDGEHLGVSSNDK